jgi:hypothetical protein
VLGSSIFNGLFIVGVASSIAPIAITPRDVAPALVLGLAAVALTYPRRSGKIERWRGATMLGVYPAYLVAVLQWTTGICRPRRSADRYCACNAAPRFLGWASRTENQR